jgi:RNA polymerase sigma-70 factor (ECF subfamily)
VRSQVEQLVKRAVNGDKDAFCALVVKYQHAVYGLAFHYLKNFADAEDVAQEVFLEAYRRLGTLRHPEKFAFWLNGITVNLCKMWLRRQRGTVSIDEIGHTTGDFRSPAPDEAYEQHELSERVMEAIAQLPEPNRIVLTLQYIDGLSYQEISDFLGVPIGTVRSRLHRAKQTLKKELVDMVAQDFREHELEPEFTQRLVRFLQEEQGDIIKLWSQDMAVINEEVSEDTHRNAISAFLSLTLEHLEKDKDSVARNYHEFVETLAQEYNVGYLNAREVTEMIFLLMSILFNTGLASHSEEKQKAFSEISNRLISVASRSIDKEDGWTAAAAGRFHIEESEFAIRFCAESWGTTGGSVGGKEHGRGSGFPGYMICYYLKDPQQLIQKPVDIGTSWSERNSKGYLSQTSVESVDETLSTHAGHFSDCLRLKTVITGEGVKNEKRTPEIDVFVRGTRFMWFAPGVGLVKIEYKHEEGCITEVNLTDYSLEEASQSYFPLALGNIWRYHWTDTYRDYVNREIWRVVSREESKYRISCFNGVSHFQPGLDQSNPL